MGSLWKFISYVFHPLFATLAGVVSYYLVSPEHYLPEERSAVVLSTVAITIIVPVLFFFLFKNVGWIKSIYLEKVTERKIPLYIYIILVFVVARNVVYPTLATELYYYFIGILGALISALILVYFKCKASMHMMGISGFTVFILGLSIHYEVNITLALSVMVMSMGLVASSRLYVKAHNNIELWIGLFIGAISQLTVFKYWL